MTDYATMPAGPDLDWLVNERVMKRNSDGTVRSIGTITLGSWSPSTNIAHAWEVVEQIQSLGYSSKHIQANGDFGWWRWSFVCGFGPCERHGNPAPTWHGSEAEAKTAPLAICRAALAAVAS